MSSEEIVRSSYDFFYFVQALPVSLWREMSVDRGRNFTLNPRIPPPLSPSKGGRVTLNLFYQKRHQRLSTRNYGISRRKR